MTDHRFPTVAPVGCDSVIPFGRCTRTDPHPVGECANFPDHERDHVGATCVDGCDDCQADHDNLHTPEGWGMQWRSFRPRYDDCQHCEAVWYSQQLGTGSEG